jgi:hypothetical protein
MIQKVTRKKERTHAISYEAWNLRSLNFVLKRTINVNLFKIRNWKILKEEQPLF